MKRRVTWSAVLLATAGAALGCGSDGGGGADAAPEDPAASTDDLELIFPRMYSGYDGVHEYRIPVKVLGFKDATFSASDPSMVSIAKEGDGAMITTRKAGEVTIIADRRGLRGTAKLTITAYTPAQWEAGNERYNHGVAYQFPKYDPCAPVDTGPPKFPGRLSCTNCHGVTGIILRGIRHNPTQIGGWTDEELVGVFTQGKKPAKYVEHGVIRVEEWSAIHKWEVDQNERVGVIAYLRSLEPREVGSPKDYGGSGYMGDAGTPEPEVDAGSPPPVPEIPEIPQGGACDAGARR